MAERRDDLDRWVEHGLISSEQRDAILAFERERVEERGEEGPGRLANAVSTVGAAVAIAAVGGIIALVAEDWTSTQAMVAAMTGSVVMIAAAWILVRNGWGAPGGLCALCGLALMPLALGFAVDAAGWWPEDSPRKDPDELDRERQRIIGSVLLLSILPGLAVARLGLRQAWALMPLALWFGATLLVTDFLESAPVVMAQVVAGILVAGLAAFVWKPEERGRGAAWWLQLGGLTLAALGIAFSVGEDRIIYAVLGVLAAGAIFVVGVTRNRTAWMVAGALASIFPAGRIIFDYFEGLAGLLIIAILGLAAAFLPLILWRRGSLRLSNDRRQRGGT